MARHHAPSWHHVTAPSQNAYLTFYSICWIVSTNCCRQIELSFTPFFPNITWCLMYFLFGSEFCALYADCKGNKLYGCITCAQKVTQLHKYKSRLWDNLPMPISCCNTINNADSTCMEHLFSKFNDLSNQIINLSFDCGNINLSIHTVNQGPVPDFKLSFKVQRWLEEKNWQNIF